MSARAPRRLPGFRFETQAPPLPEVLPRMDIAVFVGFAASGPLQTPVPVESEPQFTAIFGDDAPLAWDLVRGEEIHAHLGPAVRAFFRNGGQRCWIIRVARQNANNTQPLNRARYNYFPIPYLARAEFNPNGQIGSITPAFARGRSEGSWSDALRVSTALLSRPIQVNGALQHYVRNSRHEAASAARRLGAALGRPVAVTGLVAFVDAGSLSVRTAPTDVLIAVGESVDRLLSARPAVLMPDHVQAVYAVARRAEIWTA